MGRGRVLSKDLAKLIDAVGKWRDEHGGGGRGKKVPEELWKEAVRVARTDGVWLTAKAARFNYQSLKQRIERGEGEDAPYERTRTPGSERKRAKRTTRARAGRGARLRATEFVEVSGAQLLGGPVVIGAVVEVEDDGGGQMIVRLPNAHVNDVARVIGALRGRGA